MKRGFKLIVFTLFCLILLVKQGFGQVTPKDTSVAFIVDTLRVVCIYADTGKALNRTDKMGRKQGLWEKKYPNGVVRYRGHFLNDKPTGIFKYYYDNDSIRIISIFSDNGKVARSHEYYSSGALISTGKYVDQQKDSVWKYYDGTEKVVKKEQYNLGKKEGKEVILYASGNVEETKTWHDGLEDGPWQEFFENGELKIDGNYVKGKLEGPVIFYDPGNKLAIKGYYTNDLKDGQWIYYSEERNSTDTVIYNKGHMLNASKYILTPERQDSIKKAYQEQIQNQPQKPKIVQDYGDGG
jgi:antitoxin component YwqK of YwqJK toxin-antitoxin module